MPMTLALATLVLAPTPDFDGLTLSGVTPNEPTVNGATKAWSIQNILEMNDAKMLTGLTNVNVTDAAALPKKPTGEEIVKLHHAAMDRLPGFLGTNLSKYTAKMGDHPVALTFGSAMVPAGGGGYMAGYVASMATMVGDKIYEVVRMKTSGPFAELDFKEFKSATIMNGETKLEMKEFPDIWSKEFQLGGLPFQLDWSAVPSPIVGTKLEGFRNGYSALAVFENWVVEYELRLLQPGEALMPEEFLKKAFVNGLRHMTMTVSDVTKVEGEDRWTARVAFSAEGSPPQKGRVVILKRGDWVAAQLMRGQTEVPATLDEKFKLVLQK